MPSFRFVVPGQPVSVNHAYQPAYYRNRAGQTVRRMAKMPGVENYQLVAATMARRAKPAGFAPIGQIRVRYWIRSKRLLDASNCLKIVEDGIAIGLGVNDKVFLPSVLENSKGHSDPHIEIEVEYVESGLADD